VSEANEACNCYLGGGAAATSGLLRDMSLLVLMWLSLPGPVHVGKPTRDVLRSTRSTLIALRRPWHDCYQLAGGCERINAGYNVVDIIFYPPSWPKPHTADFPLHGHPESG
jgi:hypothetical protein